MAVTPSGELAAVEKFILWARKEGIQISELVVGNVRLIMSDLKLLTGDDDDDGDGDGDEDDSGEDQGWEKDLPARDTAHGLYADKFDLHDDPEEKGKRPSGHPRGRQQ